MRLPLLAVVASLSLCCVALLGVGLGLAPQRLAQVHPSLGEPEGPDVVPVTTPAPGMRFGIDASAVGEFQTHAGTAPDYGTLWVGRWNNEKGWRGTDAGLAQLRAANVTPAIHLWYWGDDIAPACLDVGCNGKDAAGWDRVTRDLAAHMNVQLGGVPAVVILESEFNKHGVAGDERFDTMLAEKAYLIKQEYPAATVVLGFGNWNAPAWTWFDQAAAAADAIGIQALTASTRHSEERAHALFDDTLRGAQTLHEMWGKPVFVHDVAVSSYPEPNHLEVQEAALARFAAGMADLQGAGVEAVIYRSFHDVPDMNLGNHFAEAERHWGLAWHDTGELKPAGQAWIQAVQLARAPPAPAEALSTPPV